MPKTKTLQHSFGGGEVSPELFGRIDDSKYQSGLATCQNFIVTPQGPIENRPGTEYVAEVKYSDKRTFLIAFNFSNSNTIVIEAGEKYFRFHSNGKPIVTPDGKPYEVATPYDADDLFALHHVQSADVMTLCHVNYPPATLSRYGVLDWRYEVINFVSPIKPPDKVTVTTKGNLNPKGEPDTAYDYFYVVTSVMPDLITESYESQYAKVSSNLFITGCSNTISWDGVVGAKVYNVYKMQAGIYGFIGQTDGLSIVDSNIAPDVGVTPPLFDKIFDSPGNYPGSVSYYQQRKAFAGTLNQPNNIWMTKSGTESIMSYSLPVRDNDRIAFRVAARDANQIQHIVPLTQLCMLTSAAEWQITSVNSDAITPVTISVAPQAHIGANPVQPQTINNNLVYASARGGHVRELAYSWQSSGFVTGDLSIRAAHLFDSLEIKDMSYSKAPKPIVWCISSNGKLLGLTYVPEQQVGAWHQHVTANGKFRTVSVVPENNIYGGNEDFVYVIVEREINGKTVQYVERMASRQFTKLSDAFFVDCGARYEGLPITKLSGINWLEGETVSILADGAVLPQQVVKNGTIVLPKPTQTVHVGLPMQAVARKLPFAQQIDNAMGQGRMKNISKAWLRVYRSSGIDIGPDLDHLTEYAQRKMEQPGTPPNMITDEIHIILSPSWGASGQIVVVQNNPLPLTLVSLTLEVSMGG